MSWRRCSTLRGQLFWGRIAQRSVVPVLTWHTPAQLHMLYSLPLTFPTEHAKQIKWAYVFHLVLWPLLQTALKWILLSVHIKAKQMWFWNLNALSVSAESAILRHVMNIKIIHLVNDEDLMPISMVDYYWEKHLKNEEIWVTFLHNTQQCCLFVPSHIRLRHAEALLPHVKLGCSFTLHSINIQFYEHCSGPSSVCAVNMLCGM